MELSKEFSFAAAHNLTEYKGKCEHLHGHTYRVRVTISGSPRDNGMIMDFTVLGGTIEAKVIDRLDHSYINDILEQPSVENLVIWIWKQLQDSLPLSEIKVWESPGSFVTCTQQDIEE